jgi:hypothetical protein
VAVTNATRDGGVIASCSFCGKPNTDVRTIVAGPGVFICDECTRLCQRVIDEQGPGVARAQPWEQSATLETVLATMPRVAAASAQIDDTLGRLVTRAREMGASWARIGGALGVTRQTAWERFATDA